MQLYLHSGKPVCCICAVENHFALQVAVKVDMHMYAKLLHPPSFSDKFIDYCSWVINLLLDILVCSITVYFFSLFVFGLALVSWSKYSTTHINNIQQYYPPKRLMGYSRKNPHPHDGWDSGNSRRRGVKDHGNPGGRGG